MPVRPAIVPNLVYEDAPAAIDFLCRAFGFERHAVYHDEASPEIVVHAQLTLGGNMIMVSTASRAQAKFRLSTPKETGGVVTGSNYIVLDDPDAHHGRAEAAGAIIIGAPQDNDYGGRGYSARDPEGNMWSFGSYDPWA